MKRNARWLICLNLACVAFPASVLFAAEEDVPPKEQSIYVPYEKLWEVFEKEGRGVFLPYERFIELWKAAEKVRPKRVTPEPPVSYLVSRVSGNAVVSKDVLTVKADITVEVLKKGWHEIPIGLGDVAITSATVGGAPARLVRRDGRDYHLLVEKKDDAAEPLTLQLEFARQYTKTPGRNSVSFRTPPAPVSRWDVTIPEPGVKVDIHPLLAATDAPTTSEKSETHVLAFVGATPSMRIEWTPKAEGAKGLKALANARAEHRVTIDEGVTRNVARLTYEISRTELSQLQLQVPAGHKVVNVFDANVREWSVQGAADGQTVTVQLFEPTKGTQVLNVELERFSDDAEVTVPVVKALGVARQQGVVAVRVDSALRAEAGKREGLFQLDKHELPGALARGKWDFAYRYAALPFGLVLSVEKIRPRILVDSLVEVHLEPDALTLDFFAIYDVQKAGVFRIGVDVPTGFSVRHVRGVGHAGAQPVHVSRHHTEDLEGVRRINVDLSRKAQGKAGVTIRLHRPLREPDLLAPTGKSAAIPVPIPRAGITGVERETGRLIVYGPESLRINPAQTEGLRVVSQSEAVRNMPSSRRRGERPALAFAYAEEGTVLSLSASRRAPHVTVRQLLQARIESGVVKYEATFNYDILYSGVKGLRIDVPAARAGRIRITTPDVRRRVIEGIPADLEEGYVSWMLEGETEFMGQRRFTLQWETKIDQLDIGKTVALSVPRLVPRTVDRAWGQVVIAKAEAIDVTPAEGYAGLRPIDPRHDLMPGAAVTDGARAFEFHGDWSLAVNATRYEPKEIKVTSIERGVVRAVVTRGDVTSVQALYRVRSARQRLVIRLPGDVRFDTQPLRINGRPVSLEQGNEGEYFVPLVTQQQDKPFLLELRYVVSGGGPALRVPEFPDDPAAQQVYLSVFLPRDLVYLGSVGAWNDEFIWVVRGLNTWPRGRKSSSELLDWVASGLGIDQGSLGNFATDGRHILFSTLRPEPGPDGGVRIVAVRGWVLQTVLLTLIVGLGALLLPVALGRRAVVVGAAVVLLVVLAVFTPSFARAAVNNATAAAGFIVLVVWVLWFLLVTAPRSPYWQEQKRAKAAARALRKAPPPLPRPEPREADKTPPDAGPGSSGQPGSAGAEGGQKDDK